MSGHSKWATIRRKKEATDAKRGQLFTKVSREISVAARQGGPDPEANFRLRLAIQKARGVNMPADNIKRAVEKATSEGAGAANFEEIVYEGFGPGGAAVIVEALTDNRNRTVAEVRNVFNRSGGRMGETGSVGWMFDERGLIVIEPTKDQSPDDIALAAIEAGAEDVNEVEDGSVEVYTQLHDLKAVQDALAAEGYSIASAEKTYMPKTTVEPADGEADGVLRLVDKLEDLDDVQGVYTNLEINEPVSVNTGVSV
ncbi:MAG: YebC/PmpR family DNA-binding transcriptional regulator [Chloroflexota bacterium]|nr:YebC/PmpR family DNA-binding transcriptional regulator [Chloroflexota bacterium]